MNETPIGDNLIDEASVESRNKIERSLSDRILGYAFVASIFVNIGWVALVSGSNLFGKGSISAPMREKPIKVFHPIPVKPKPKPIKPPPPPPKQKVQPKITPIKPHPTPPRPTPTRVVNVVQSNNSHLQNQIVMPTSPPTSDQGPVNPGVQSPPAPRTPPAPPTVAPPSPPVAAPPSPPSPPAVKSPPPPPPPPPPPVPPPPPPRPRNYTPIGSQEAGPIGDYSSPSVPEGLDVTTLSSTSVTISFEIDENGHASGVHVSKSCGNSELDDACKEAVRNTRFQPAVQDHLKLRASVEHTYQVGS